jgi:uncharacterized protein
MTEPGAWQAARIVAIAGGRIVGRTRLQKIGCLLDIAGAGVGFRFTYHHYGPYSEELRIAAEDASALGLIEIDEHRAAWGGHYSIYRSSTEAAHDAPQLVRRLGQAAASADSIELELAVTAAFLAKHGEKDPWQEVAVLKSEKATEDRLVKARSLYRTLALPGLPVELPRI